MIQKTVTSTPKNVYADAPFLHSNLFLGSLQFLFWLFFRPSIWQKNIARLDPTLHPHFNLGDLEQTHWQNHNLRRLFFMGHIVNPLIAGLTVCLIGLVLFVWQGDPKSLYYGVLQTGDLGYLSRHVHINQIIFGLIQSIFFAMFIGLMISTILSVSSGMMIGFIGGIIWGLTGLIFGIVAEFQRGMPVYGAGLSLGVFLDLGMNINGNIFGFAIPAAVTGATILKYDNRGMVVSSLARKGVGFIIGIVATTLVLIASGFVASAILRLQDSFTWPRAIFGSAVLILSIFVTIKIHTNYWKRSFQYSSLIIIVGVVIATVAYSQTAPFLFCTFPKKTTMLTSQGCAFFQIIFGVFMGLVTGAAFTALFLSSYVAANKFGGAWVGVIVGTLMAGVGGLILGAMSERSIDLESNIRQLWQVPVLGLIGIGITWWLPAVLYPFELVWNWLIYRLDILRGTAADFSLRWHSAFWNELQWLPLVGLDKHLLLAIERNPAEGQLALDYVAAGQQRWAARRTQVELDARRLEGCENIADISTAHEYLIAAGELGGEVSAILRSFQRISEDTQAALEPASHYRQRLALKGVVDRLNGLEHEFNRSEGRNSSRFRPIVEHWRQLVASHINYLAQLAEAQQEIDNPYIASVPLTKQEEIFVGRHDMSARIEGLLLDKRRPPLLLYGQRRMGKTSLLINLGRLLPQHVIPLFVDLQGPIGATKSEADFLYNLAKAMHKSAVKERGLILPALSEAALAEKPFTTFDEWLDAVEAVNNGFEEPLYLLALDEFEVLEHAFVSKRLDEMLILNLLRHMIQHRTRFKVLLSGSHSLAEFRHWASQLINTQVIHIGYLSEAEAMQLIEQPVQGFTLRYEPTASQHVYALTRGHPYWVQQLCSEIVMLKNEQEPARRRLAQVSDVETAVPRALADGELFFGDIVRNRIDENGLLLLQFLAQQGEHGVASHVGFQQRFPNISVKHTLRLLLERELIEQHDDGYRFQVELIRRWFAQHTEFD